MTDDRPQPSPFELVPHDAQMPYPAPAPADPYPGMDDEGGQIDVRRYIGAVLRFKWWILVLLVLGSAAGYVASRYVPAQYVARATLWIDQGPGVAGPIRSGGLLESSAWVDLLRSFTVLDHVAIQERLYLKTQNPADDALFEGLSLRDRVAPGRYRITVDPSSREYVLETHEGLLVERGAFGDSVGGETLGFNWQPDFGRFPRGRPVDFTVSVPRDVASSLNDQVRAGIDQTGGFLRISMRGEDPERLAAVVNAVAERHVEVAAELKRAKLDSVVTILEEQLLYAEQALKNAESSLENFKIATVTLPTERSTPLVPGVQMTRGPVFENFFTNQVDLQLNRTQQDVLRRAISSPSGVSVEALQSVGAVSQVPDLGNALSELTEARAALRALRARYTDEHRSVAMAAEQVRTLEQETIPGLVRVLLTELQARETELERTISSAGQDLRQIPPRAIEEQRLSRQVTIQAELYTTLEERYQAARLSAASSVPDLRILDRAAVPQRPVQDDKNMVLLLGMLAGLGLGVAGAILRDLLDSRIRYPTQVTRGMGLEILGAVPTIRQRKTKQEQLTQVLESFRSIRLNVTHAFDTAGPVTFTVSSPGPGDGKSFVAANLAVAFADQGHRTVLVDGDIRRGGLHHLLEADRKPGLTDFLGDRAEREILIRGTRFDRLDLIPSGTRVRQGPELLGSPNMRDLLASLKADYDVVIVDSPPLGAGVDPFALGTLTGNLLMVVRSGTTNKELAESKLELVRRLPIRVLGAVLNGLPQDRQYGYGYYSYSYVSGYDATDELEEGAPRTLVRAGGEADQ